MKKVILTTLAICATSITINQITSVLGAIIADIIAIFILRSIIILLVYSNSVKGLIKRNGSCSRCKMREQLKW